MDIRKHFHRCSLVFCVSLFLAEALFAAPQEVVQVILDNYNKQPSLVVESLQSLESSEFESLNGDLLVKASYASAIVANVELTMRLTEVLLDKATRGENDILKGQAYYNRGAAYAQAGKHSLALDSLLMSLLSFENTTSEIDIARIKGGLGLIYVELGEYELAKPYFNEAINSHKARGDKQNLAVVLQNQGFMKIRTGDFLSAKKDLLVALSYATELDLHSYYPVLFKNLGKIEAALGDTQKAIDYFEEAILESQSSQVEHHQSEILREYAQLLYTNGDIEGSRDKLTLSFAVAERFDLQKQLRNNYALLAELEAHENNFEAAYFAREKALQPLAEMGESTIATNLSRLERYTTRIKEQNKRLVLEQEKKIATLAAERQQLMKNFSIAIATIALLLVIYFFRRFSHTNRQAVHFEQQSKIDPLTGIWNRRAGEAQLNRLCARDNNAVKVFSIGMLDIDFFKKINDKFGHDVGDQVIIAICNLIQDTLRPSDMLCRWGGEEFIIIWDNFDVTKAYEVCERIRQKIESSVIEPIGKLTVSIGIAMYENDDIYELIKRGDQAMYSAKHEGRNRVIINHKPESNETSEASIAVQ